MTETRCPDTQRLASNEETFSDIELKSMEYLEKTLDEERTDVLDS